MSALVPDPGEQILFLRKIQKLLDEGSFSSTYKYALLMALADLSVEYGDTDCDALTLGVSHISEKLVEYYWRQALPYSSSSLIIQNSGQQAKIINDIVSIRNSNSGSISRAKRDGKIWTKLINDINSTVIKMPLWKLQILSHGVDDFLYPNNERGSEITLRVGVASNFRTFHGLIQGMIQGAWLRWVRRLEKNQSTLGQSVNLDEFMFGSERNNLSIYEPFLRDQQDNKCFYCEEGLRPNKFAVDHFIPWIRYPHDLAHNFVLAHPGCNGDKRDLLAADKHLEKWYRRNVDDSTLANFYDSNNLTHNIKHSHAIASWAYKQTEDVNGDVWVSKGVTQGISTLWNSVFV